MDIIAALIDEERGEVDRLLATVATDDLLSVEWVGVALVWAVRAERQRRAD